MVIWGILIVALFYLLVCFLMSAACYAVLIVRDLVKLAWVILKPREE